MQGLTLVSHQRGVQQGVRECGGPFPTFLRAGPPPLGVVPPGYAVDQGSCSANCLGNWQGGKMCAPCANHKLRPVRKNARHHHPLPHYTFIDHDTEASTDSDEEFRPDVEQPTRIPRPQQAKLPDDISKYINSDA